MKPLTAKQLEAVRLMCDGGTPKDIAIALNIEPKAVCARLKQAREKYEAETNEQLAFLVGREKGKEAAVKQAQEAASYEPNTQYGQNQSMPPIRINGYPVTWGTERR